MKKQVELSITHNGKNVVAYPYTKKEHVQFENGMNIDEFVGQDIATPTITHDTTAIKVGVGDSDVSSSVVDSAVNMTIKGQTYQNILPEPTLRNEMQGKSMQRLNEGYDNIEVVDGVSKSAILSGQTLVNIAKKQEKPFSHSADKVLQNNHLQLSHSLKANTTYTRYIHVSALDLGTTSNVVMYDALYGEDGSYSQYSYVVTSKGWIINTFTPKTTSINPYMINPDMNALSNGLIYIEIDKFMIIEGDYTNVDIPYFEGMQSVKMPVLQTYDGNIMRLSPPQHTTNGVTVEKINDVEFLFNQGSRQGIGGWKWNIPNGEAFTLSFHYEKVSGCENQCQVHVSCAGGISDKFDLSEQFGDFEKTFYVRRTTPTLVEFKPVGEITSTKSVLKISNLKWYIGNKVYSDKTNILHTPEEVVLRSLPNGVCDTLNLNTGEYVQRIGEVVLDGGENWVYEPTYTNDNVYGCYIGFEQLPQKPKPNNFNFANNMFPNITNNSYSQEGFATNPGVLSLRINKNKLDSNDVSGFKKYLQNHPITLQYPLATESIKTVDLSSHGNWEKIVLDGKSSENWQQNTHDENFAQFDGYSNFCLYSLNLPLANKGLLCDKLPYFNYDSGFRNICVEGISDGGGYHLVFMRIKTNKLPSNDIIGLKQYLSQNPITVWYQTTTTQDNSIREMLSFANGHLQVSSEAENSLLPSVQYEIPTKNSYHMDLMKTNTLYTMKAKTVSGTFTIDGTSYNVNANGTFTSPSSMTDKLLVMSNRTNEEVMLLEGNVIDKTIPYFKGIKSAFEDEDKIEVLSTGKNLFNHVPESLIGKTSNGMNVSISNGKIKITGTPTGTYGYVEIVNCMEKGKQYTFSAYENGQLATSGYRLWVRYSDGTLSNPASGGTFVVKNLDIVRVEFVFEGFTVGTAVNKEVNIQIEEGSIATSYEPFKSNITKIPLLSPLRSLPNGVCDELVIDRLNHKAKLIQRVGELVLNGNEEWTQSQIRDKHYIVMLRHCSEVGIPEKYPSTLLCSRFINQQPYNYDREGINVHTNYNFHIGFLKNRLLDASVNSCKKWLSQNPTTVLYELNTPIITEIDLEGYPYAYKDGHIFLNSDIAPTTQITYSINQAQQIESANENLQRHEKEISHLQKLIAQYIQVEYESTLLSLKL